VLLSLRIKRTGNNIMRPIRFITLAGLSMLSQLGTGKDHGHDPASGHFDRQRGSTERLTMEMWHNGSTRPNGQLLIITTRRYDHTTTDRRTAGQCLTTGQPTSPPDETSAAKSAVAECQGTRRKKRHSAKYL